MFEQSSLYGLYLNLKCFLSAKWDWSLYSSTNHCKLMQIIRCCQYCRGDLGSEQTVAKLIDGRLGHALSLDVHPPSLAVLVATPLEALQALVEVTGNGVQRRATESATRVFNVTAVTGAGRTGRWCKITRWYKHCKLGT